MATNYDETNQYDLNAHYWLYQFTELDIIMKAIAIPKDRYFAEEEREDASRNRESSKVGKLIGADYETYDAKVLVESILLDDSNLIASERPRSAALKDIDAKKPETSSMKNVKVYDDDDKSNKTISNDRKSHKRLSKR